MPAEYLRGEGGGRTAEEVGEAVRVEGVGAALRPSEFGYEGGAVDVGADRCGGGGHGLSIGWRCGLVEVVAAGERFVVEVIQREAGPAAGVREAVQAGPVAP